MLTRNGCPPGRRPRLVKDILRENGNMTELYRLSREFSLVQQIFAAAPNVYRLKSCTISPPPGDDVIWMKSAIISSCQRCSVASRDRSHVFGALGFT
jgi:hypothetical protein